MTRPLAAVARRLAPPPAGSDAELLDRYRLGRDEAAFAALVRRHAPAVRAVARARLGNVADADDVTQAAFLVLARDAGRVRESVAGFLVRVAHLTALQHRRNLARRQAGPLPDELAKGDDPASVAAARETVAVVAEELAGLPDKLRSVIALCTLDGLTAAVAAERLGVPKGTVDTRLATAKRRLADRLTRRGLAVGSVASLVAVPASAESAEVLARAAVGYAGGVAAPSPVSLLADGVRPIMSHTVRLFALGLVASALTGTAGMALLSGGPADDKPQAKKPPTKPADPPPATAELATDPPEKPRLVDETSVRNLLGQPTTIREPQGLTFGDVLVQLEAQGVDTRIDLPALLRAGMLQQDLTTLRDRKLHTFGGRGTTWADLLADATAGIEWERGSGPTGRLTYWVSGRRVVIGPAYRTPALPGGGDGSAPFLPPEQVMEQLVGPPVSVALDGQPLSRAVTELRALTGANIVIDARAKEQASERVAGTFDDVRLLTVLQVLADQAGLAPVTLNNVYYLTSPENAASLQRQADRDLHGPQQPSIGGPGVAIPAGFVTDGYQYFPRTADMKPVDPRTVGAFGLGHLGGGGGAGVQPLPGTQPVPAPAAKK